MILNFNFTGFSDLLWKTICGTVSAILGYFLPIKDLVHLIILFFLVDMIFGYCAARKLRGEKFSTRIVWHTTFPRMLISIVLIIMAYLWDTTCHQDWLPTYNLIGWFISGILIFSIAKNGYKVTKWRGFIGLENLLQKKIKDETGINLPKNLILILVFLFSAVISHAQTYLKAADKDDYNKNYLPYCQAPVERTFIMKGEVTLLLVNGYYHQPNGDYIAKFPLVVKWYPIEVRNTVCESYQQDITAYFKANVPRRYPWSVDDYYKNWKTGKIQAGDMDSKFCGICPYPLK